MGSVIVTGTSTRSTDTFIGRSWVVKPDSFTTSAAVSGLGTIRGLMWTSSSVFCARATGHARNTANAMNKDDSTFKEKRSLRSMFLIPVLRGAEWRVRNRVLGEDPHPRWRAMQSTSIDGDRTTVPSRQNQGNMVFRMRFYE